MIPSHILAAGASPLSVRTIVGGGLIGLVATGTNQATALQLVASNSAITTSSASTGVKLPPCEEGAELCIYNGSGVTITIYPFETSGVTFNSAAASVTLINGKAIICKAVVTTLWITNTSA